MSIFGIPEYFNNGRDYRNAEPDGDADNKGKYELAPLRHIVDKLIFTLIMAPESENRISEHSNPAEP